MPTLKARAAAFLQDTQPWDVPFALLEPSVLDHVAAATLLPLHESGATMKRAWGGQTASRVARQNLLVSGAVNDVTLMLQAVQENDAQGAEKLLPLVYEELRRAAGQKMALQPPGQTLQATALVHEAFLKLTHNPDKTWQNRRHFFAAASEAMRHILVDRARSKAAVRHGGDQVRLELEDVTIAGAAPDDQLIAIHEALARLAMHDPDVAELVQLRFFAGLTFEQAAELLGISERTAKRQWAYARAWLFDEIKRTAGSGR